MYEPVLLVTKLIRHNLMGYSFWTLNNYQDKI